MEKFSKISLTLGLLLLTFPLARAQNFPWDDFKPRTLNYIIKENILIQKGSMKEVKSKHQIIIDADPLPSVIRLTYTGKTRPISKERKNYLKLWIDSFDKDKVFNDLYDVEILVTEGSTQYWLLVQKQLLPAFKKEIGVGEPVDLYLIRMGGFLTDGGWDWMFIVEEFRKPDSDSTPAFPWNDFERRTLLELVNTNVEENADDFTRYPDKGQLVFRGKIMPSVVRVSYTGESRRISSERKKFIELWAATYSSTPHYGSFYESEFLFKEGAVEYWLPVAKQIIPSFSKELREGELVDLYLIRPGGLKVKDQADWVFLVEEFQKPKDKEWPSP